MAKKYIVLCIILFIGSLLRLYKLADIPNGLYQDETAIGYNAYSIAETGRDEHGRTLPLYFESFGDQKLPVYIYLTSIAEKLFGLNAFAVRFPSAFFGILSLVMIFFYVKKITSNYTYALITTCLLAINPWHIHYSRATFEVSLVLFFLLTGLTLLHVALEKQRRGIFLVSIIFFIFALYTYNLTRILSPILFCSYLILYRHQLKHVSTLEKSITSLIAILFTLPFFITLFSPGGASSASGTLIHSSAAVQAPLVEFRSYITTVPLLNKFFNYYVMTFWQYIENIASYLSVPFFYINGSTHGNHGIGTHGQFYLIELPLFITGVIALWKKKHLFLPFMLPAIITIVIAAFTREAPHATRSFTLLLTIPVCTAIGIVSLYEQLKRFSPNIQLVSRILLFSIFAVFILSYITSYMYRFPVYYAPQWRFADRNLSQYLAEQIGSYDQILIDRDAGFIYTSLAFYTAFSPQQFQETVTRSGRDKEGFIEVQSFGPYRFTSIDWEKDIHLPNTLIVTNNRKLPTNITVLKTFTYPIRPVVIADKQTLLQYPVEEIAYQVIRTNK